MCCFIGMVLLALLPFSSALAHDPFVLDARRAVPGNVRLELLEVPRTSTVKYRVNAFGLPSRVVFSLLTKDFSHSFHEIGTGLQLDESGKFVLIKSKNGGQLQRLDELVLEPGPYPKGAAWEVAMISADRSIRAFTKAIPYPILTRDGRCMVSLELVSQRGDQFLASGSGFVPGEEVVTESRYSGRMIQKRQTISAEGLLLPVAISHGARGTERNAQYSVKSRSCEVAVEYEWGEPAIARY